MQLLLIGLVRSCYQLRWIVIDSEFLFLRFSFGDLLRFISFKIKLREKICLHLISTGFGFSEKPQPGYGFDYTLDGNALVALMMADKC